MIESKLPLARSRLLAWYDLHRRDLPWRSGEGEPADPYRVWLSEIMLQQTRVETVRPYFIRWLRRFPTLGALAEAPLDDVLKAWEGLGYYSRARNFHRAVREVSHSYGGAVPNDPLAFRALPGVGRYTAGAVMSIAFGREEPIVDGNVRRVLARWIDAERPSEAELWRLASILVIGERPGSLNQALMELGALVCTPRAPRCDACPVADLCTARAAGTQQERPARRRRAPLPHEDRVAAIVQEDERVLVARRHSRGRLAGMWEFPGDLLLPEEAPGEAAERVLPRAVGVKIQAAETGAVVDHTFTHVRVSYHVVRATSSCGGARPIGYDEVRWVAPDELRKLALSRVQRRIAALALPPATISTLSAQG